MRRRLSFLLSLLSLLLCVATSVLWVLAPFTDHYHRLTKHREYLFDGREGISIVLLHAWSKPIIGSEHRRSNRTDETPPELKAFVKGHPPYIKYGGGPFFLLIGPELRLSKSEPPRFWATSTEIRMPFWFAVFVLLVLPMLTAGKLMYQRPNRVNQCDVCGYSTTGNTSGTCPECGTAIPKATRPA